MDLTSLQAVKDWLAVTSTDDDELLQRLITQISGVTLNYLQRPALTRQTYTELRDGVGNQRMVIRNWPVIKISSLMVNGSNVPAGNYSPQQPGYMLATWDGTSAGLPQELTLLGYSYCRGKNNIQIVYDAGNAVESQPYTVPGAAP